MDKGVKFLNFGDFAIDYSQALRQELWVLLSGESWVLILLGAAGSGGHV